MDGASSLGLWMLPVAAALIFSGLPAWTALLTTALGFALGAVALGVPWHDFGVLPARLTGLLESDLLQALPLFVLMGCVLNRLPVARGMLRVCEGAFTRLRAGAAATPLAALTVSALLAPVNGSVGASVGMLWRTVNPTLEQQRMPAARRAALIAACSTLGVVIPPSLVLVLLGDAMMTAHTIAVNKTGAMVRIINTQDVMHAALLPAALLVAGYALWLLAQGWRARLGTPRDSAAPGASIHASHDVAHNALHDVSQDAEAPLTRSARITALAAIAFILTLLGAVATGVMYAVEAAAFAAVAALAYGVATRQLRGPVLRGALHDALALSGALFALLVAATTFSLVFRSLGTDRWLDDFMAHAALAPRALTALVMAALMVCALALDAFEIVFVAVPIFMPPLLTQVSDAAWVATLTLLVLQLSFMLPPLGFALLLVRGQLRCSQTAADSSLGSTAMMRALAPFIGLQLVVLLLVFTFPRLTHPAGGEPTAVPRAPAPSEQKVDDLLRQMSAPDAPDNAASAPSATQ